MKIGGVIVAGGMATRMGGTEKLLLQVGGKTVLELMLAIVTPQVDAIAINVRDSSRGLYEHRIPPHIALVSDPCAGMGGPLGGVLAGLTWLFGLGPEFNWLATFPGDTPFLPRDLVSALKSCLQPRSSRPVVAYNLERVESLCALWPVTLLGDLSKGMRQGHLRSVRDALEEFAAVRVQLGFAHSFINLNTTGDLAEAERLMQSQPQVLNVNVRQ